MKKTVKVKKNQSLLDLAVELYGSIEGVYDLVDENNLLGVMDNLEPGSNVTYNDNLVISSRIAAICREEGVATLDSEVRGDGIGWMEIYEPPTKSDGDSKEDAAKPDSDSTEDAIKPDGDSTEDATKPDSDSTEEEVEWIDAKKYFKIF